MVAQLLMQLTAMMSHDVFKTYEIAHTKSNAHITIFDIQLWTPHDAIGTMAVV